MSEPGATPIAPALLDPWMRGTEMPERMCSVDGCERSVCARGWCEMHYRRWKKHGDPLNAGVSSEELFWSKVEKTETCWLWKGAVGNRYAQFPIKRKKYLAHRLAYEWLVGPIPDGLQLDHLCRVTTCVNPAHLEPVTASENQLRAVPFRAVKTHCPKGHPYSGDNLVLAGPRKTQRRCRQCALEANRRWYARNPGRRPKGES